MRHGPKPLRALAKRLGLVVANPKGATVSIHLALLPRLRPEQVPLVVVVQPSELLDLSRDVRVVVEGISEVRLRFVGEEAEVVDVLYVFPAQTIKSKCICRQDCSENLHKNIYQKNITSSINRKSDVDRHTSS